jgi:glyoxylase-like metal-dependent hydrolase (beta-lactamase superfamily II)
MKTNRTSRVSRSQFLVFTAIATTGVWLMPRRLLAEAESPVIVICRAAATAKINIQKLRGNVSVLEGSDGNIAVLTGRDGKLLVDAGITASRPRITEALKNLSADPVKHLINTHWHFDHTDGNEWLHSIGAEITAHENSRETSFGSPLSGMGKRI